MKKGAFVTGVLALVLLFGFVLSGCATVAGEKDSAQSHYQKGLELAKQEKYLDSSEIKYGIFFDTTVEIPGAITEFSKAIEMKPDYAEAYYERSMVYFKLSIWDTEYSKDDLEKSIRRWENIEWFNDVKIVPYFRDKAKVDFSKVISINPAFKERITTQLEEKFKSLDNGQPSETLIVIVTLSIDIDPSNDSWYRRRGQINYAQENYTAAETDFTAAINLSPDNPVYYNWRGVTHYANAREAERGLSSGLAMLFGGALGVSARDTTGFMRKEIEDGYNLALADYSEAIRLDTNKSLYFYNRGYTFSRKGDLGLAIADWTEALRIDPEWANAEAQNVPKLIADAKAKGFDRSKFAMLPTGFNPAPYNYTDLFQAVAIVETMPRGNGSLEDAVGGELGASMGIQVNIRYFASDVVFVSQNGTNIRFKTSDNAIAQDMKTDERSGLTSGQKVRIYYRVEKNPLTVWQVHAIERL